MIKIALAITGASGAIYAKLCMEILSKMLKPDEVGVVMSDNAATVWQTELEEETYKNYGFRFFDKHDFHAPIASGSAGCEAMIVVPCSMGTLSRIAQGTSNDLVTRAADVMLKERRKLVCVVRETPYSLIHIKNMAALTEAGGIVCPATPSFYSKPQTIEEVALTVVHRALALAGFDVKDRFKWGA